MYNCYDLKLLFFLAAVPPDFSMEPPQNVTVFNGDFGNLECPIQQGNLYNHLNPYLFSWNEWEDSLFSPPVDPSLLSMNNRVISVLINDVTGSKYYRCRLQLRRCTTCSVVLHNGPLMRFNVLGKKVVL